MAATAGDDAATNRKGALFATGPKPADTPRWQKIVNSIGPKVRELRQELGLSLQQLSARADVSSAAIHKIERNDMVPTITTLLKLAAALHRPVGYFIDEETMITPTVVHTPAAERRPGETPHEGVAVGEISGPPEHFRAAGAVVTIEPGATLRARAATRPGEELLLVLDGVLEVSVGEDRFTLRKGDALHYLTDHPYTWANRSRRPACVVRFAANDS